jgi:hypothetical protein
MSCVCVCILWAVTAHTQSNSGELEGIGFHQVRMQYTLVNQQNISQPVCARLSVQPRQQHA